MKTKPHSSFVIRHLSFATLVAAFTLFTATPRAPAQTNVTISGADFQRLVYSAHLHAELTLHPELEASLKVLLEMQRRNPNADPAALVNVLTNALQFYRTNAPDYIRTNGYPDEVLAAYLDALRQVSAHTNFVFADLTLLNIFMLNESDYNSYTNTSVLDLINSADQRLTSRRGATLNRQTLVDDCVARARGNGVFASAMDKLLWPAAGVWLGETPAEITGDTNSPLHGDLTMATLLALASINGSLTVSSNQLVGLFSAEMQTVEDTITTNLSLRAQINQSQPDWLAYLSNTNAMNADAQLVAAVQQGQPVKLASATAAVLVQSKLLPVDTQSAEAEQAVSAVGDIAFGILGLSKEDPEIGGLDGIMSGGIDLFNMFTGAQSPQDVMATQIQNIQTMIGDLNANVNYRFDRVDQSLTTIFDTMNQQFQWITNYFDTTLDCQVARLQGNVYSIRNSLVSVQASLDRIEAENFASASAGQQDQIVGPIDIDLVYTRYPATRGPFPEVGFGSSGGGYEADEGLFYKYAMNDANNDISSPHSSLDLLPLHLAQQLAARPLDANLNFIQQYLISMGVNTVGTPDPNKPLANPQEWFIAAYAYLQLAGENPMYFRKDADKGEVSDIIGRGQSDANFCSNLTFSGGHINSNLYAALENCYITNLNAFNSDVSAFESQYATTSNFVLDTWRQWEIAAPRVTATVSVDTAAATELIVTPAMLLSPIPPRATSVSAGYSHSLALKADGTIAGWGNNSYGQTTIPVSATNVVAVAAGYSHNLALRADGTVVSWGDNTYGQTNVPAGLSNRVAVAAGQYFSLALKSDHTVVGWGRNNFGQTNTTGLSNVVAIAAGDNHGLALKTDSTVTNWGNGYYGQLTSTGQSNVIAVAAGGSHNLALKADRTVFGWGYNKYGEATGVPTTNAVPPVGLAVVTLGGQTLSNAIAIAAGESHSLALKADGTVVGWGDNTYGQTAIPLGLTNVVAIAAGAYHSLALKADGTVVAWGRIYERQCLVPPALTWQRALSASWAHFLGLRPDGNPTDCGLNADYGRPAIPASATNVVAIAAGDGHSLALQPDGTIVAWGAWGGYTNIPLAATNVVAIAAGNSFSLALKGDSTVVGWDNNSSGSTNVPTGLTNVLAIAASRDNSLALRSDGTVVGWGDNSHGQTNVPTGLSSVVAIATGHYHNLALKADGTIVGWGFNNYGQTNVPAWLRNVVAIAAGDYHSLALKADGTVVAWGWNFYGQTNVPIGLSNVVAIGAGGDYCLALQADGTVVAWGGALNAHASISASETNVVAIAAGNDYNLALRSDGTVIGWGGYNDLGETTIPAGLSAVVAIAAESDFCLALRTDGTVVGWGYNGDGEATGIANGGPGLVIIGSSFLTNVVAIAAGANHSLALKANGTVVGWGYNYYGEATGVPNTNYPSDSAGPVTLPGQALTNEVAIAAGTFHSLALRADRTVIGWGDQTNIPSGLTNVMAIATGESHSLALKADGTVIGWGDNTYGQTNIPIGLSNVVAIAAGANHSLALKADGTVVGWGDNYFGQIIIPTTATSLVAIAAGGNHSLFLKATATTGLAGGGHSSVVRAQIPVRVGALFHCCNQNMLAELAGSGSTFDNDAANLSGAKALLAAVLELGMSRTLERDGVLHGFLYGSESLVDNDSAIGFLQNQNAELGVSPDAPPQALTGVGALRYNRFTNWLSQCLINLRQPEVPRLLGHTLRLLNLLNDAWVTPTNSPPPALQTLMVSNRPSLLLYGEPFVNYTLQSCGSLSAPNWTNTAITFQGGQTNAVPDSSSLKRFYRAVTDLPSLQ